MQSHVLLFILGGCALGLVLYPVARAVRGRGSRFDLVIGLSIPLLVALVMFLGSAPAFAQKVNAGVPGIAFRDPVGVAGPYSVWFPPGQAQYVTQLPPTTTAIPSSAGPGGAPAVAVNGGGTAVATRPQMPDIKVPVNTRMVVPGAAAAAAAARVAGAARALAGPAGAAWLAWDIYKQVKDSGVYTCPPPDFFCFPPTITYDRKQLGWRLGAFNRMGSLSDHQTYLVNLYQGSVQNTKDECVGPPTGCTPVVTWTIKAKDGGIVTFSAQFLEGEIIKSTKDGPKMEDGDLENHMKGKAAGDPTGKTAKDYYDAAMDGDIKMRQSGAPGVSPDVILPPTISPTTITSPPVTVGPDNLGSKTGTDATGQPTVTTNTGTITITPSPQGAGNATTINYNVTYTTNNTTTYPNSPSTPPRTETEVIIIRVEPGSAPAPAPAPQLEIPNDYNKEVTQQKILNVLNGEGVPDGSDLSSEEPESQVKGAQATISQTMEGVTPGGLGLESWLPQVPTAACVNPEVPNPITGEMRAVEICKPVSLFQKFISAVICVFVLYGCVREVQSAVKS